jgi:hypothetical protein
MFSQVSYNSMENDKSRWNQFGGTGVTISEDLRARKSEHGSDPTKLDRWTFVRVHRRQGEATVFVSTYRPCKNKIGPGSVWSQQNQYWEEERTKTTKKQQS